MDPSLVQELLLGRDQYACTASPLAVSFPRRATQGHAQGPVFGADTLPYGVFMALSWGLGYVDALPFVR